ncbi:MAG: hypothetical protein IMZ43_08705 [Thermoplasmata archaeon]|nr:hypothetical protein [Thermoplasmata archaeon]
MPNITFNIEATEKILDKLTRLGSSFLIFGGAIILISIFVNHTNGLKLGILTLFFGGVFRLYNGFTKTFMGQVKGMELSWRDFTIITAVRFGFWFLLVFWYLLFANQLII